MQKQATGAEISEMLKRMICPLDRAPSAFFQAQLQLDWLNSEYSKIASSLEPHRKTVLDFMSARKVERLDRRELPAWPGLAPIFPEVRSLDIAWIPLLAMANLTHTETVPKKIVACSSRKPIAAQSLALVCRPGLALEFLRNSNLPGSGPLRHTLRVPFKGTISLSTFDPIFRQDSSGTSIGYI